MNLRPRQSELSFPASCGGGLAVDPLVTGSPRRCWRRLGNLQADRRGVATIEYAFLASLIAVSLVASFALLGAAVTGHFDRVSDAVERSLGSHYQSGN